MSAQTQTLQPRSALLNNSPMPHTRISTRLSTYSGAPSINPSIAPTVATTTTERSTGSSVSQEGNEDFKAWSATFERLNDKRLQSQRYTPSPAKSDDLSRLALGAKLERALGRRMTGQDAVWNPRKSMIVTSEKK